MKTVLAAMQTHTTEQNLKKKITNTTIRETDNGDTLIKTHSDLNFAYSFL